MLLMVKSRKQAAARVRHYPVALEEVSARDQESPSQVVRPPVRPPHGVPMVRPAVRRRTEDTERRSPEVLAQAARYAHLQHVEDGASMEIGIDEDLFAGLACQVSVEQGRVLATFKVGRDPNLRRLLEAEKGRLRTALEGRGMRKVEIVIEG